MRNFWPSKESWDDTIYLILLGGWVSGDSFVRVTCSIQERPRCHGIIFVYIGDFHSFILQALGQLLSSLTWDYSNCIEMSNNHGASIAA
ncbi:unnamed protein product [Cercopithifilaria johnstoni]|uniref:Uncharacterized protein n=1 Tax=Cercopithifilaria johnstoni TaxID=2874296 RepID=A0A8J2MUY6_9BILA|nr:unnamed protein product [Cercopithifilaria johnstoni]